MDVLAEAHGEAELERLLRLDLDVVGVNARDLRTFEVDLDAIVAARTRIPSDRVAVAESGVRTAADATRIAEAGFDAVLCGEGLMRGASPRERMQELFGGRDG
jgi:indole-3-glycerol phosphate synthase